MLKIVICEDDYEQRDHLRELLYRQIALNDYPASIALCTSDPSGVRAYLANNLATREPHDACAYFLDIDLKQKDTGLVLAHQIRKKDPKAYIIFVTVMQKHMRNAFRYKAFDFIVKSYSTVMDVDVSGVLERLVDDYSEWYVENEPPARIKFESLSNSVSVTIDEFVGIKKDGSNYSAYTTQGVYRYFKSLQNLLDRVDGYPNIVRCHKCAIINLDHIARFDRDNRTIHTTTGVKFPIARRRVNEVKKLWQSRL